MTDRLDLYPLAGTLDGSALDLSDLAPYVDSDRDWNGEPRPGTFRGAYAGEGANPGWLPALERKPDAAAIFAVGLEAGSVAAWSSSVGVL